MKLYIPVVILTLASGVAHAQSFTVKKVKGKQAIVQMTSGSFTEGQSVTVGGSEASSSSSMGGGGSGSRGKFIGLEGGFTSSKVTNGTATTISTNVIYGWNKSSMEYGVIGGLTLVSGGGANLTTIIVGGRFDYNFGENRPGNDGIMYAGIDATYGMTSGGAANTNTINLFPNVGYKMFALGNSTAIRFAVGMNIAQNSGGAGGSTSDTQPGASFGLSTYF